MSRPTMAVFPVNLLQNIFCLVAVLSFRFEGGAVRLKQSQSETWLLGLFPPANQLQLQSRTSRFVRLPT